MTTLGFVLLFLLGSLQPQSFNTFLLRLKLLSVDKRPAAVKEYLDAARTTPIVENNSDVHFVWYGRATTVILNGDLQRGWTVPDTMESVPCGDFTFFYRSYIVPPDTRVDYQFNVDGKYGTDPRNPKITPSGYGPHSELAMPAFVSNPILKYRPDGPHGTLDSLVWKSRDDTLRPRVVRIYKPFAYETLNALPTLYVHDGDDALEFEHFTTILDNLIADKTIKPLVAIFIPPVEREKEYVGWKDREFATMLCDELVPIIDRTYHTSGNPRDRAMMGISNGGHISLATVLKRPDVFLNAAGQSSTITLQLLEILDCAASHRSSHEPFRIYTDVGTYDLDYPGADKSFLSANREFGADLTRDGIDHVYREVNDGHEWANWRERTEDILKLFFGGK